MALILQSQDCLVFSPGIIIILDIIFRKKQQQYSKVVKLAIYTHLALMSECTQQLTQAQDFNNVKSKVMEQPKN